MRDLDLQSDARKLLDQRRNGRIAGDSPSLEDAVLGLAGALGQDTAMIYRLVSEVTRLSDELDELRRAVGVEPPA